MCGHNGQLGVALELGASLPSEAEVQRWYGEPVFQTNKRGFPALSKAHQAVLLSFFQLNVQVRHTCVVSLSHFDKPCLWVNAKSACPHLRWQTVPWCVLLFVEAQAAEEVLRRMLIGLVVIGLVYKAYPNGRQHKYILGKATALPHAGPLAPVMLMCCHWDAQGPPAGLYHDAHHTSSLVLCPQ